MWKLQDIRILRIILTYGKCRFIDSLSAKIHPAPLSADQLSDLFQEFYILAGQHIATHIQTLSSRQHRAATKNSPSSSRSSSAAKKTSLRGKPKPERQGSGQSSEQQLVSASELADRRRARKLLEHKRIALEEAVERRVCEGIYDRIWRHRSTQDEASDEKLRSRTAALAVVGIGLKELSIDLGPDSEASTEETSKEDAVREWLAGARDGLMKMNDEKYPLGKLLHLKAAHKSIVDTLSHFHRGASSSADEILPTLIYTLITSPPEGMNVISNLYFIQRFRAADKVDGEAAYCLTNLEAAVTFLETVDLASLRADEAASGPPRSPGFAASAAKAETSNSTTGLSDATTAPTTASNVTAKAGITRTPTGLSSDSLAAPSSQIHGRRLSNLLNPPTLALTNAADGMINTADQSLKTIGNTLENSYKFLFGRLQERQIKSPGVASGAEVTVPKTLDEARKLVGTPPLADAMDEKEGIASSNSSINEDETYVKASDKMLNLIGGRNVVRDRSVDSARSGGSGKRVGFSDDIAEAKATSSRPSLAQRLEAATASTGSLSGTASPNPGVAAVESMRNLGNTLNPLNRLTSFGSLRPFARNTATPTTPPTSTSGGSKQLGDGEITASPEASVGLSSVSYPHHLSVLLADLPIIDCTR
jgi:Vacuolar sorting protein 9 (VPS9) domain